MKPGHIFWGTFFIVLGILFFINSSFGINIDENFLYYWPVILILIGVLFIIKSSPLKWIFSFLTGIIVALFIFIIFDNSFNIFDVDFDRDNNFSAHSIYSDSYSEDLSSSIKEGNLFVKTGIGKIFLDEETDKLFEIKSSSALSHHELKFDTLNQKADINFEMVGGKHKFRNLKFNKQNVDIKLNNKISWNINFEIGAAKAEIDLANLNTQFVNFKSGASSVKIRMGEKSDYTKLKFETGASKYDIEVPQNVGCQINSDLGLSKKEFNGFEKIDNGTYQTENFDKSKKKIIIDMQAGISSIEVNRY